MIRKRRIENGKQATEAGRDCLEVAAGSVLTGQGLSRLDAIRRIGVVEQTYYRWRKKDFFAEYHPQFKEPLTLPDAVAGGLDDYAAIFFLGGHGALIGLPESSAVGDALKWAAANDKFVISLCHGQAAFLAVGDSGIYQGYKICAFPDVMDAMTPDTGYMPGHLTWKFGEKLKAIGFEILNEEISGVVHQDRKMLTGDSPLAGNNLGKLAAEAMLKELKNEG